MRRGQVTQALRGSSLWWITLLAGAAIAQPASAAETTLWHALRNTTGPVPATLIIVTSTALIAIAAFALLGRIRLPGKTTAYRIAYPLRMAPWRARELLAGGHPGNGSRNEQYPSESAFTTADPRRRPRCDGGLGRQIDYGVGWYTPEGGHRLTWIQATGELVAVAPTGPRGDQDHVEILAHIPSEIEVEQRLRGWPYATNDLCWARRRAHGWNVPLPPHGKYWLTEDNKPPKPWPDPPQPSVNRAEGAYVGTQTAHQNSQVTITDTHGTRPLYHHVLHSPTGYSWGYDGDGPHDLARSILYDRLGYVPAETIYSQFCADIVYNLPADFTLTYKQVDNWIKKHGKLFADNPKAEPFDPYAHGGAY